MRVLVIPLLTAWLAGGCATVTTELPGYEERAISRSDGPLSISVAALSPVESAEAYGRPLAAFGIQPVWVRVENHDTVPYWFMPLGMDPNYFPYWEAAEAFTLAEGKLFDYSEREHFQQLGLPSQIPPGTVTTGFVLTNLEEGFKFVHADFISSGVLRHTSAMVYVPGFRADYEQEGRAREEAWVGVETVDFGEDQAAFRQALAALPCCVTNKKGSRNGDPLNLVIVGGPEDAFPALAERGWRATETTWAGSLLRMMKSALRREPYHYAPISPLYLFGRSQDFALQKARNNIHQRNHLRLWRAPMEFRGRPVWVGQISRDIGSRLTLRSPYLTTHKIDPDVDEARSALAEDMVYTRQLAEAGWVTGVGAADRDRPRQNLTGDPYYSDGMRLVMIFSRTTTPINEVEFLPWEKVNEERVDAP